MNRAHAALLAVAAAALLRPHTAAAEITIAEWRDGVGVFELAGYARSITGYHDLGYGGPRRASTRSLNMGIGRLEWSAEFGPDLEVRLHDNFTWNVAAPTQRSAGGDFFGVGASRRSEPTVDLESTLIDDPGTRLTHDVDRLAVDIYTDPVDLTVGRQGITWGEAAIFPVADLWSRFSPFDLDTERKPGADAVRALFYPNMKSELDVVIADRGTLAGLSGGARYAGTVGRTDLYAAAGKFWDELVAMAGATVVFDRLKLRAELAEPLDLEPVRVALQRATGGAELFGADFSLGVEYHFNGAGAAKTNRYDDELADEQFQRGETYLLGRHYAGLHGSYTGLPDVEMSVSAIGNLLDSSAIVSPSLTYEVAQNASVGLGALLSAGAHPRHAPVDSFQSEFGAYGDFYFVEFAAHY